MTKKESNQRWTLGKEGRNGGVKMKSRRNGMKDDRSKVHMKRKEGNEGKNT